MITKTPKNVLWNHFNHYLARLHENQSKTRDTQRFGLLSNKGRRRKI